LGRAAGEASEIIGKGLIDALMILSGDTTVDELAVSMETLASNTAKAVTELAKLVKGVVNFSTESYGKVDNFADDITDFLDRLTGHEERIAERARAAATAGMGGYPSSALGGTFIDPNAAARKAAEAAAAKRAKELAALQRKTLDTQKKTLALQKASKTLNLEAIGIEAALKGKISETDRISLELQKAILDGNAVMAEKLAKDLEAAVKRNNELRLALLATPEAPNPYRNWKAPEFGQLVPPSAVLPPMPPRDPNAIGPVPFVPPTFNVPGNVGGGLGLEDLRGKSSAVPNVYVSVKVGEEDLAAIITSSQTNESLSGSFVGINRSRNRGAVAIE